MTGKKILTNSNERFACYTGGLLIKEKSWNKLSYLQEGSVLFTGYTTLCHSHPLLLIQLMSN